MTAQAAAAIALDLALEVLGLAIDESQDQIDAGRNSMASADALQAAADRLRLTAEQFQVVRYAAGMAGASQEELQAALAHFVMALEQAREGTGALHEILADNGIDLRDAADGSCGYSRDSKIFLTLSNRMICSDRALP